MRLGVSKLRNDKGYALLMVLAVVVIIGLIVPPMAYSIISSSAQAEKMKEEYRGDSLVDMGKQYARVHVIEALNGNEDMGYSGVHNVTEGSVSVHDVVSYFREVFIGGHNDLKIEELRFENTVGEVGIYFEDVRELAGNEVGVSYEIVVLLSGDEIARESEEFVLGQGAENNGNGQDIGNGVGDEDSGSGESDWYDEDGISSDRLDGITVEVDDDYSFSSNDEIPENSLFQGELRLTGRGDYVQQGSMGLNGGMSSLGSNSTIDIKGDLYVFGSVVEISRNTELYVRGDLYMSDAVFDFRHDVGFVCVEGNIYDSDHPNDFSRVDSCEQLQSSEVESGVYYEGTNEGVVGNEEGSGWEPFSTSQ